MSCLGVMTSVMSVVDFYSSTVGLGATLCVSAASWLISGSCVSVSF